MNPAHPKHLDLPHGDLLDQRILVHLDELLYGHQRAVFSAAALVHHPVAPFSDLAQPFVLLHPLHRVTSIWPNNTRYKGYLEITFWNPKQCTFVSICLKLWPLAL